jgi:threonine dehydrogenase-like Zn-dependent dehydrogenase
MVVDIMKAITVEPGTANSVRLEERSEPQSDDGTSLLVQTVALGVCGTDREIISCTYDWAPPNTKRLVLGHESPGRVLEAPDGGGCAAGDLVVGIVRRPGPVPCPACGVGEWDMCCNGLYAERGIRSVDGYRAERFPLEPASVLAFDEAMA